MRGFNRGELAAMFPFAREVQCAMEEPVVRGGERSRTMRIGGIVEVVLKHLSCDKGGLFKAAHDLAFAGHCGVLLMP